MRKRLTRKVFCVSTVPAFEACCQVMFHQMNESFEKGLEQRLPEALSQQFQSNVMSSMIDVANSLNKSITESQNKIIHELRTPISTAVTAVGERSPTPLSSLSDLKTEILNQLQKDSYEEGFSMALNAQNVELLCWLCSRVDPQKLFSSSSPALSQFVLLSLIQQLAFDLTRDSLLKLSWLSEVLLVVDPSDKVIADHGVGILKKLITNLEQHTNKFASNADLSKRCKTLIYVVNSLISRLQ